MIFSFARTSVLVAPTHTKLPSSFRRKMSKFSFIEVGLGRRLATPSTCGVGACRCWEAYSNRGAAFNSRTVASRPFPDNASRFPPADATSRPDLWYRCAARIKVVSLPCAGAGNEYRNGNSKSAAKPVKQRNNPDFRARTPCGRASREKSQQILSGG